MPAADPSSVRDVVEVISIGRLARACWRRRGEEHWFVMLTVLPPTLSCEVTQPIARCA